MSDSNNSANAGALTLLRDVRALPDPGASFLPVNAKCNIWLKNGPKVLRSSICDLNWSTSTGINDGQ